MWGLTPPPHPRGSAGRFTPHFREERVLRRGRENRLTAKPEHVGMLRIFRQLRKYRKGTHRRLRLTPSLRYPPHPPQRFTRFPYLSLSCLFGALACYLSLIVYPLPILAYLRDSLSAVIPSHSPSCQSHALGAVHYLQAAFASPQTSATLRALPSDSHLPPSPDGATDYRRGQATRSPRSR